MRPRARERGLFGGIALERRLTLCQALEKIGGDGDRAGLAGFRAADRGGGTGFALAACRGRRGLGAIGARWSIFTP